MPTVSPHTHVPGSVGFPDAEPELRIRCHDLLREGSRMWPQGKFVLGLIHREDLEHKLYPSVDPVPPEARKSPFQLIIDCRPLTFQANGSHKLRAVLWRKANVHSSESCGR